MSDMDGATYDVSLSAIRMSTRAPTFLIVPFCAIYLYVFCTRDLMRAVKCSIAEERL